MKKWTNDLGLNQLKMKSNLYYIDRLKAEPGTLNEIYHRWLKEYTARQKAFYARMAKWSLETSAKMLVHNGFKIGDYERDDRGHSEFFAPLKREGVWTNTEKELITGLIHTFRTIRDEETKLLEEESEKSWRMEELKKETERIKQQQDEEEERKRRDEEEEKEKKADEQREKEKQKKDKEKRKAKQKKERDEIENATNNELKDTMSKMAEYQKLIALLQADLMAGKITPEVFSAKITEASANL